MSIQRTSAEVHAGGRVAEALYGVAIDMLGPTLDQDLSYQQRARLLRTLDVPVGEVARRAIESLESELAIALRNEPSLASAGPVAPVGPGIVTTAGRVSRLDFE